MAGTFLGIGLGPIQTGIFLDGAARGGFDRLVVAEVDAALVRAVRDGGGVVRIGIAGKEAVTLREIGGIEVFNPMEAADREALIAAAAQADEVATALPSIAVYRRLEWLREGWARDGRRRFVYAAENHHHAAEALEAALGAVPGTHFLNTVIGKMSCIVPAEACAQRGIPPLTPSADRGHLVEAFHHILVQACEGLDARAVKDLFAKPDLLPFEEAKLYGHNGMHFWIGLQAQRRGIRFMHEAAADRALMARARAAFVEECGRALCAKWSGADALFTPRGFAAYADDLLTRMTNPFLADRVDRICRDLERKMGWDDRLIGAMRVGLAHGVAPAVLGEGAALGARGLFGDDPDAIRQGLAALWGRWDDEAAALWHHIAPHLASSNPTRSSR